MKQHRMTYAILTFVVILWGVNVVMIKYLLGYFPPLALATIRMALAAFSLLPAILRSSQLAVPRRAWWPIIGVAFFSILVHQLFLAFGLANTSATHASLLLGLNPLVTALLASRYAAEPLSAAKIIGIILGFCGVLLVVSGNTHSIATPFGDALIFAATLAAVLGYLCVKKATTLVSPLIVTAYSHPLAAAGLIFLTLCSGDAWSYGNIKDAWPLIMLLISSFGSTALGGYLWNRGIQRIGASNTSLFQNGIPIAGIFASALFLYEPLGWHHIAALFLVLSGVSLGSGAWQRK
ncbi:DMT family transporter [Azotosporobacter soli]|uniref:DMT family transporter n=1 Tax=Azotosporobacter soli TaxID=3055040 RepID=UPI0031FE4F0A